eukprot:m.79570 g.79570  ORF g.79570 m.79570 type:complete len:272 (+) comp11982_c0_seq1:111-926(+)
MMKTHTKCIGGKYHGGPERGNVNAISWDDKDEAYAPVEFTHEAVAKNPVWADDPTKLKTFKFNEGNRKSHEAKYRVTKDNMPLNPIGRTGVTGRGLLGKFGPNFAADPIVTRWKRNQDNVVVCDKSGKPILQIVLIKRKDTGEWALPGGMVDEGEKVSITLAREFGEEAMSSLDVPEREKKIIHFRIEDAFKHGTTIYEGYVDDPRNTDNAWMETTAVNFHDETGETFSAFELKAGDDAGDVSWVDFHPDLKLYASHNSFVEAVYNMHVKK